MFYESSLNLGPGNIKFYEDQSGDSSWEMKLGKDKTLIKLSFSLNNISSYCWLEKWGKNMLMSYCILATLDIKNMSKCDNIKSKGR